MKTENIFCVKILASESCQVTGQSINYNLSPRYKMHSVSLIRSFSRLNLECRLQPVISTSQSSFHTTSVQESRIKRRHVHKPFFHIKKTAKHADEPLTGANARFVQQMVKQSYGTSILDTYVRPDSEENSEEGSPLRPELRPWPRGSWDEQGVFTTRVGLIGRKIGVVPMWDNRGRRMTTTLIQVKILKSCRIWNFTDFYF